jgi:hypothetical protein
VLGEGKLPAGSEGVTLLTMGWIGRDAAKSTSEALWGQSQPGSFWQDSIWHGAEGMQGTGE